MESILSNKIKSIILILTSCVLFEFFFVYDFGFGIIRAFIILFIYFLCIAGLKVARKNDGVLSPKSYYLSISAIFIIVLINLLTFSYLGYRKTISLGFYDLDQGQNSWRAYHLAKNGYNPYSKDFILDADTYYLYLEDLIQKKCASIDASSYHKIFKEYYKTLNPELKSMLLPRIKNYENCKEFEDRKKSFGYKYGPAILGIYSVFFDFFGLNGMIYANLSFMLIGLFFIFSFLFKATRNQYLPGILTAIPLIIPGSLYRHGLMSPTTDVIPMILSWFSLYFLIEKRNLLSALTLGVALACKTVPVVLFWIGALAMNPYVAIIAAGTGALFFIPFILHDPIGAYYNFIYFLFSKKPDSTSLVFFMNDYAIYVKLIAIIIASWYLVDLFLKRTVSAYLRFIVISIVVTLLSINIMHNNYLIWLHLSLCPFLFISLFLNRNKLSAFPLRSGSKKGCNPEDLNKSTN